MPSKLSTQETLYFNRLSRFIIKRVPPRLMCALYNVLIALIFTLEKYHYDSPNRGLSALAQRTGVTYDVWLVLGVTVACLLIGDRNIRRLFVYYMLTVLFILGLVIVSWRSGGDVLAFVLSSWYTLLMPFMLIRGLVQEIALHNAIEKSVNLERNAIKDREVIEQFQTLLERHGIGHG